MGDVLEVSGVRKTFGGVHAVDGVSFTLREGEIRALIGPNGAGKTTFFNILTGQLRADAGTVRFRGRPIDGLSPWAIWSRGIGRTFQITATFATLSVLENVQVARLSHVGKSRALFHSARTRASAGSASVRVSASRARSSSTSASARSPTSPPRASPTQR